jgi:DNA primase
MGRLAVGPAAWVHEPSGMLETVRRALARQVDIVTVIGAYGLLRVQGSELIGDCPLHTPGRRTLVVDRDRGRFRCCVCGTGGDAVAYVAAAEGLSLLVAAQRIAERAGIPWTSLDAG